MTSNSASRKLFLPLLGGAVVALGALVVFLGMSRAEPQLQLDEDVFTTVDALFTAITSRDQRRLDACQTRLDQFRSEQRVPAHAARVLDEVQRQARDGQWEPASRRLYDFMLAQRGESNS